MNWILSVLATKLTNASTTVLFARQCIYAANKRKLLIIIIIIIIIIVIINIINIIIIIIIITAFTFSQFITGGPPGFKYLLLT